MPPECSGLVTWPLYSLIERVSCVVSNRRMTEDRASFADLISLGYLLSPWGYSTTQMVVFEICPGPIRSVERRARATALSRIRTFPDNDKPLRFCQQLRALSLLRNRWSVVGMKISIGLLTLESWLCSFGSLDFRTLRDHRHHPGLSWWSVF